MSDPKNKDKTDRDTRLYEALKSNDTGVLNKEFRSVRKALIDYLRFTMRAGQAGAEDAVSLAFLKALEAIHQNKIEKKESLYSWLLQTSRSIYRDEKNKLLNRITEKEHFDEDFYVAPDEQVQLMQDEERMRLLKLCMELLTDDMRKTLDYFLKNPDTPVIKASEILNINYMTLRRRRSRITHKLHECVQEKLRNFEL